MKKRIISLLTTLVMVVGLIGVMPVVSAGAATTLVSGGTEKINASNIEFSKEYGVSLNNGGTRWFKFTTKSTNDYWYNLSVKDISVGNHNGFSGISGCIYDYFNERYTYADSFNGSVGVDGAKLEPSTTYYVAIYGRKEGNIKFQLDATYDEYSDVKEQAKSVSFETKYESSIDSPGGITDDRKDDNVSGDVDYVKFYTGNNTNVKLYLNNIDVEYYNTYFEGLAAIVLDSYGEQYGYLEVRPNREGYIELKLQKNTYYYVKLFSTSGGTGNYSFSLSTPIGTVSGFKTSSVSSSAAKLTWNKVSGAQGYIVYKYDNSKKTWVRAAKTTTTANTYTVSKLASGTSYKFAVKAYKTVNGKEITSSSFPMVIATTLLPTVTGFRTSAISPTAVKLTWNKVSGATGYIVYKYDNSKKTWVRVAKTKTTANTYTVSKLASGTSYKFAVNPYKTVSGKEVTSSSFPTVTAITKLPAVVNGTTTVGKNSVKLTWKKTTGATGYIVYKYDNSKKTWVRVSKTGSLNYLVKNLKSNTNYKFAVKAYKNVSGKEITSVSFKTISVRTKK